jgi:hypothetical protein
MNNKQPMQQHGTRQERSVCVVPTILFAAIERRSSRFNTVESGGPFVVQQSNEAPGDFARRVRDYLRQMPEHRTRNAGEALLFLGPGFDAAVIEARCQVALAVLRRFAHTPVSVVLICDERASADARAHVMALAEGLTEGSPGREVVVRFAA